MAHASQRAQRQRDTNMITTANKFQTIPAFEIVATTICNTQRETTAELIHAYAATTHGFDTERFWAELATTADTDEAAMVELQEDVAARLSELSTLADYCTVQFGDRDWIVAPDPELCEDVTRVEELPDRYEEDEYLVVNDHGNATLYQWHHAEQKYVEIWSIV